MRPAGRAWPPCRAFVAPAAAALFGPVCASGGLLRCLWGSPLPPPRPGAPAGGSRGARGPFGWASPPAAWVALLAPLLRPPPARCARPGAPISARLTVRKLSTGVYTKCVRAPPPLSHCPALSRLRPGALRAALTFARFFLPGGLDFPGPFVVYWCSGARSAPSGAAPAGCPWTAKAAWSYRPGGFFLCSGLLPALPEMIPLPTRPPPCLT